MFRYKFLVSILSLFLVVTLTRGQNEDNALNYSYDRPTGTARSIALGGAMGALGGDYSAIGINPAGIAVYRSSEFSFTPSLIFNTTESDYYGTVSSDDKFSVPFNQISYVGTSRLMRENIDGIVSTHFGIGYNRTNNYNRKSYITAENIQSSLLDEIVYRSRGLRTNKDELLTNYPFYSSYMLEPLPLHYYYLHNDILIDNSNAKESDQYHHAWEYIDLDNPSINESNDTIYSVLFGIPEEINGSPYGIDQTRVIKESGYQAEYNLTFGANFGNKFLFGAAFNLATTFNRKEFLHMESNPEAYYYDAHIAYHQSSSTLLKEFSYSDYEKTTGVGINFIFGVIYKPVNNIRIGASIKTPTYYSMNMEYETKASPIFFDIEQKPVTFNGEASFNFRTPLNLTG
ncbi:MAG: hypothetical protein PWQ17_1174, partial [Anaerophaga sp.]|nr:hypothetical protein [Anaerophaga sp.]